MPSGLRQKTCSETRPRDRQSSHEKIGTGPKAVFPHLAYPARRRIFHSQRFAHPAGAPIGTSKKPERQRPHGDGQGQQSQFRHHANKIASWSQKTRGNHSRRKSWEKFRAAWLATVRGILKAAERHSEQAQFPRHTGTQRVCLANLTGSSGQTTSHDPRTFNQMLITLSLASTATEIGSKAHRGTSIDFRQEPQMITVDEASGKTSQGEVAMGQKFISPQFAGQPHESVWQPSFAPFPLAQVHNQDGGTLVPV